jgi:hypothetical protein
MLKTANCFLIKLLGSLFLLIFWFSQINGQTLRIDFELKSDSVHCSVNKAVICKELGQNWKQTIPYDSARQGEFRVKMFDSKHKLLAGYTFSGLVLENRNMHRNDSLLFSVFKETVYFPFYNQDVIVELSVLNEHTFEYENVWQKNIKPSGVKVIAKQKRKVEIVKKASRYPSVVFLFVSDGYTTAELNDFKQKCNRYADSLLTIPALKKYSEHIEFQSLFVPTASHRFDLVDTATLGVERYYAITNTWRLADKLSGLSVNHVIVLANTENYGGSGFFKRYLVVNAANYYAVKVLLHEFGHSFGGLGDEYDSDPLLCNIPPAGADYGYPNISAMPNGKVKWQKWLLPETPIPTPNVEKYKNSVGAFEGAAYCSKHLYRPVSNCLMRTLDPGFFCPVCNEAIEYQINKIIFGLHAK